MFRLCVLLLASVCGLASVWARSSYYWHTRTLECANHGLYVSRCTLFQQGRQTEMNPECFEEPDQKNNTRIYCRLNCEESDETTVLSKVPSWNHDCNSHFTYQLERRRMDWYLWRSAACINTTITFHVRCGFPRDLRLFYIQNKHLFEYEDQA